MSTNAIQLNNEHDHAGKTDLTAKYNAINNHNNETDKSFQSVVSDKIISNGEKVAHNDNKYASLNFIPGDILSKILIESGPLPMRKITAEIIKYLPQFKSFSTSKQRRLIVNALEIGDETNNIIFEKIGWGLWQVKELNPNDNFQKERAILNELNSKIRENSDLRSKNVINEKVNHSMVPNSTINNSTYIDENVLLLSEDEDEDDDDDEDDDEKRQRRRMIKEQIFDPNDDMYTMRRRTSSVVFAEQDLIAQKIRPMIQQRSRRSSSKTYSNEYRPYIMKNVMNDKSQEHISASNSPAKIASINKKKKQDIITVPTATTTMGTLNTIRRRSSSITRESNIRNLPNPMVADSKVEKPTRSTPVISPLSLSATSLPLVPTSPTLGIRNTSDKQNSDKALVSGSDTEDEDWSKMDPKTLRGEQYGVVDGEKFANSQEVAKLLLSLK